MRKQIISILSLSFINTIGFSILIPVLPFLVERYGGGPILYGALLSAYSLFQFIGSPVLGALSDTHGRKPILMISHFGTFLGWMVFILAFYLPEISLWGGIALPLAVVALSRAIDGITGGNISVASAYLSDSVEPAERTKSFGLMGATFGFGMLIGPVIGSLILATPLGYAGVGMVAGALSLITLIAMQVWLPESLSPSQRSHQDTSTRLLQRANVFARIAHYSKNRQVKILFFMRVIFSMGFVGYVSIFIFHAIHFFHLSELESAKFMLFTGTFLIINQLFAIKWFVKRFGEAGTFSFGQAFMLFALAAVSFAHSVPVFIAFYYFLNLGVSLSMASFKALIIRSVSEKQRGEVMGIEESLVALVQSIVPALAGLLYASLGIFTFLCLSSLIVLVFVIIYFHSRSLVFRVVPYEKSEA